MLHRKWIAGVAGAEGLLDTVLAGCRGVCSRSFGGGPRKNHGPGGNTPGKIIVS